MYISALSRPLL